MVPIYLRNYIFLLQHLLRPFYADSHLIRVVKFHELSTKNEHIIHFPLEILGFFGQQIVVSTVNAIFRLRLKLFCRFAIAWTGLIAF